MAPVEIIHMPEPDSPNPFTVKNTFLHFGNDATDDLLEFGEMDLINRRQLSEPAPRRQVSNNGYAGQKLAKCEEERAGELSDSDELDDDSYGLFRQVSPFKRETAEMERQLSKTSTSNSLSKISEMDRQLSSLSAQGMDKQASAGFSGSFCRQETEVEWPTWSMPPARPPVAVEIANAVIDSIDPPQEENILNKSNRNAEVLPLMQVLPTSSQYNNAMANSMMWQNMMWQGMDANARPPAASPPQRNRRKARSLITLAQEQQKKQQKQAWAQKLQHMKQNFEFEQQQAPAQLAPASPEYGQQDGLAFSMPSEATKKEAGTKFCPYCGGSVQQHFKFCRFCGKDVAAVWDM